jgi:dihydrofolate reductase
MRRIIGAIFVSLDGVIQAPGAPEEDRTGGFEHGGWLRQFWDDESDEGLGTLFTEPFDLLLGRRTYDIFAAYWPYATGEAAPMGELFDRVGKYVLTGNDRPLGWQNSHRLSGIDALAELKRSEGPDLIMQGSGTLYPQLLGAGLIDRLVLRTFPVIIGSGKRWFDGPAAPGAMRMIQHQVTPGGNIIATYEPAGAIETGSFATEEPSAAELERRSKVEAGTW